MPKRTGKNKESPEQAPGYLRFLLEIFAYAGEQIPPHPQFSAASCGVLNHEDFNKKAEKHAENG
jgi:hypothetical protein